jgi:type IV pilus assembly protein PilP
MSGQTEAAIREEVSALIGKKEQFYSRKGRIDPFEPFLRKPEPVDVGDEKANLNRRTPRTPLEKIDLSQLKLTAVLRMLTKSRALVQESSGKGYVVNEGTYIGNKGGQVSKIFKDRIMVEEKYLDVFGKISVREREIKLQQ